jgi:hypothetical protein
MWSLDLGIPPHKTGAAAAFACRQTGPKGEAGPALRLAPAFAVAIRSYEKNQQCGLAEPAHPQSREGTVS